MSTNENTSSNLACLAVLIMLFGLLALASHGNELLKQTVIVPGSTAELGTAADCRADELEEEQLSLDECQLMVANVRIILASSPEWFRSFQLLISGLGVAGAAFSAIAAFNLINRGTKSLNATMLSILFLLLLDIFGFIGAVNTGPLLRAQYLWPLVLWLAIHVTMLASVIRLKAIR